MWDQEEDDKEEEEEEEIVLQHFIARTKAFRHKYIIFHNFTNQYGT